MPSRTGPGEQHTADDALLQELGYRSQLARRGTAFTNFAVSFSVISILSGGMTLFGFGLNTGGPAVMVWGWVAIGALVLVVGHALAEVTSAYPTSGALFDMANRLGGPRWGWYTGWLNLLGLVGAIAGIDYGCALVTGAFLNLQWGIDPTPGLVMLLFVAILAVHAALNLGGIRLLNIVNRVSVWWHLVGVAVIVVALAVVPDSHRSPEFVFTEFVNSTDFSQWWYVSLIGLLMAQYTFCGYDASAHLAEETTNASTAAARGIVRSIWVSWVAGLVLIVGLLWAMGDYDRTTGTATGFPPAQIFLDAVGATGAKLLLLVVIVAQLCCGNAETAAASRMVFAFSRNGALPGSRIWCRVTRNGTPAAAVGLTVAIALLMALPALWSTTAYAAVTAINVIGITPAYVIPVFLKLRHPERFTPGAWTLGRWSTLVGWVAVVYVAIITVVLMAPQAWPLTIGTFNYASIAGAAALILATVWWYVSGRRHYGMPVVADTGRTDQDAQYTEELV